jgi:hypothetical protein
MKFVLIAIALSLAAGVAFADSKANDPYPVLSISRSAGDDTLLRHELTEQEKRLFNAMQSGIAKLPKNAATSADHNVAIQIGAKYGLNPEQSVAFYVRTTFSLFEPGAR